MIWKYLNYNYKGKGEGIIMTISREMLFPLAFYKKSVFNGSRGKMNYRIEKKENEEKKEEFLLTVWEGPFCYDATKEEKKTFHYDFSEEGMQKIMQQLNEL